MSRVLTAIKTLNNATWKYYEAIRWVKEKEFTINAKTGKLKFRVGASKEIKRMVRYLLARDKRGIEFVRNKHSSIHEACSIYMDQGLDGDRWLVEALLVGGATPNQVEETIGIDKRIIKEYISFFFCFSKTEAKRYAFSLTTELNNYDPKKDHDICWKYIALHRGYISFINIIFNMHEMTADDSKWLDGMVNNFSRQANNRLKLTAGNITNVMNPNTRDGVFRAIEVHDRHQIMSDKTGKGIDKESALEQRINDMFETMGSEMVHVYEKFDEEEPLQTFQFNELNKGEENGEDVGKKTKALVERAG